MSVIIGEVATFPGVKPDKEQAVKVLEEASEVYESWDEWRKNDDHELIEFIESESADLIQALSNLLDSLGISDMRLAMELCKQRNIERGRFENRSSQLIRCSNCKFARIETHTGDEELVCWHHRPGYVTQPDGYCHRAVKREAVQ